MDTCATCLTGGNQTGVINQMKLYRSIRVLSACSTVIRLCLSCVSEYMRVCRIKAMLCSVQMAHSAAAVALYFKLYLSLNPSLVSTKLVSTRTASKTATSPLLAGLGINFSLFALFGELWDKLSTMEHFFSPHSSLSYPNVCLSYRL